jgi:predicted RNA-binding protein with PIN domain
MPYIIDGHNLIPKVPGLSLEAADDELQLVEMLQEFCRLSRKEAEVHFDNAPAGQPRARSYGRVTARFARAGESADQTIAARLRRLGGAARNWTVVSSDRSVQASARAARAQALSSEAFARQMAQTLQEGGREASPGEDAAPDPEDVEDWLRLFGEENEQG